MTERRQGEQDSFQHATARLGGSNAACRAFCVNSVHSLWFDWHTSSMQSCPHCGEPVDTYPDPGGGEDQTYVEDCSVCCRPILFRVTLNEELGDYEIEVSAET